MSRTVFILGAGASKGAGGPLMSEFLDVAEDLYKSGRTADFKGDFELVFKGLSQLQQTQSKFNLTFQNIESAFAAFEMASVIGKLGDMGPEDIKRLPWTMRRLIFRTIELRVRFPWQAGQILPTAEYAELVKLIKRIHPDGKWDRCSVVTFNYDLAFDYALSFNLIPIDYCLKDRGPSPALRLMKLHGSLNWKWCDQCEELAQWELGEFLKGRCVHNPSAEPVALEIAGEISKQRHTCGQRLQPFLVPPTWNKAAYGSRLARVWAAAGEELADAEEIIAMGYSLPDTDIFFKYLLALGTAGPTRVKSFCVYNPDKAVRPKFEALLGPAARERFEFRDMHFDDAVAHVAKKLGVPPEPPRGRVIVLQD